MGDRIQDAYHEMDEAGDKGLFVRYNTILCATWDLEEDPVLLPPIPSLPDLLEEDNKEVPVRLIEITALENIIIGLTNGGHVLRFNCSPPEFSPEGMRRWQYLPSFCESQTIKAEFSELGIALEDTIKITHISSNSGFDPTFVVHSTRPNSVLLVGDDAPGTPPSIILGFRNQSIAFIQFGKNRHLALTSTGQVLAWGESSDGSLGLGNLTSTGIPTQVRFDYGRKTPKERFCLSLTSGADHAAALVVDIEEGDDEDTDIEFGDGEIELEYDMPSSDETDEEGEENHEVLRAMIEEGAEIIKRLVEHV